MNKYPLILLIALSSFLYTSQAYAESAKDNYRTCCMQCHGMSGDGMGVNIQDMSVQPRNHSDAKAMSARTDAELFKVIKEGGLAINKSSLMPPWTDSLSNDEINDLVQHLHKLCQCKHQ